MKTVLWTINHQFYSYALLHVSVGQSLCYSPFNLMLVEMTQFIYSPVYSVLFGPDLFFLSNLCVEFR